MQFMGDYNKELSEVQAAKGLDSTTIIMLALAEVHTTVLAQQAEIERLKGEITNA